ncbi:conserved hypothetical protein [Xanthomonas citri pv. citri]|nr:conserved hypothetical protein [Xanthomonas citri pv. citri]
MTVGSNRVAGNSGSHIRKKGFGLSGSAYGSPNWRALYLVVRRRLNTLRSAVLGVKGERARVLRPLSRCLTTRQPLKTHWLMVPLIKIGRPISQGMLAISNLPRKAGRILYKFLSKGAEKSKRTDILSYGHTALIWFTARHDGARGALADLGRQCPQSLA